MCDHKVASMYSVPQRQRDSSGISETQGSQRFSFIYRERSIWKDASLTGTPTGAGVGGGGAETGAFCPGTHIVPPW